MSSRAARAAGCALFAVVLGAWSGDGWRVEPPWLAQLSGLQAIWAGGAFASGALLARVPRRGAATGAAFGGCAIGAYYVDMWVVQGAHSALSQLAASGGAFWVVAAVTGGAVMGALGSLTHRSPGDRRLDPAVLGWAAMVGVLVAEAVYVLWVQGRFADDPAVPATVLVLLAVGVAVFAARRTGWVPLATGLLVMAVIAPVLAVGFLELQRALAYATL